MKYHIQHFIGNRFEDSADGGVFAVLTPVTNEVIGQCASGQRSDVDKAVAAARSAFDNGSWSRMPVAERANKVRRIGDLILKHAAEIAELEIEDTGIPRRQITHGSIPRAADNFYFFADQILTFHGDAFPVDDHWINYTVHRPIGVAGLITPWNTPFMLETWKVAPALASGNTVVLKPAEWSPLSANKLAEIILEADLPPGVFNLVHGFGETAGAPLVAHPDVKLISFTGETTTGQIIIKNGADSLKRFSMELGGKSPNIIFADADLDRALDAALWQVYSLNGERCTAASRLLVEKSIHDEFVSRLAGRVKRIKVGDPGDETTEIGPLIHPEHWNRVRGYMDVAREEGATIVFGGDRPSMASPLSSFPAERGPRVGVFEAGREEGASKRGLAGGKNGQAVTELPSIEREIRAAPESASSQGRDVLVQEERRVRMSAEESHSGSPFERGNWFAPTLITGVRNDMRIAQEEIFGPVLVVLPFTDESEAIRLANDVRYGLAGYIWTRDVSRAHRVAQSLECGMVWINSHNVRDLRTPFGGSKFSGIGREGGRWSFEEFYLDTRTIQVPLKDHPIPRIG